MRSQFTIHFQDPLNFLIDHVIRETPRPGEFAGWAMDRGLNFNLTFGYDVRHNPDGNASQWHLLSALES